MQCFDSFAWSALSLIDFMHQSEVSGPCSRLSRPLIFLLVCLMAYSPIESTKYTCVCAFVSLDVEDVLHMFHLFETYTHMIASFL